MTPPPSELRAEELFQLSHISLAAISGSGCTDPDPPVTPLVLEGMLASTNIPVSILIDSGASLDAVSHNFAREHGLTMLPLKQSSAAYRPAARHPQTTQWAPQRPLIKTEGTAGKNIKR